MTIDSIRNLIVLFAAVGLVFIGMELRGLWRDLSTARRLRYISLLLMGLALVYGPLEVLYWPQYQYRVGISLAAAVTMAVAGWLAVRRPK